VAGNAPASSNVSHLPDGRHGSAPREEETANRSHGRFVEQDRRGAIDHPGPVFIDAEIFELNCRLTLFGVRL
jgi:hypothetical protein